MHVAPWIVWSTLWNGWRGNGWRGNGWRLPHTATDWPKCFCFSGLNAQKLKVDGRMALWLHLFKERLRCLKENGQFGQNQGEFLLMMSWKGVKVVKGATCLERSRQHTPSTFHCSMHIKEKVEQIQKNTFPTILRWFAFLGEKEGPKDFGLPMSKLIFYQINL